MSTRAWLGLAVLCLGGAQVSGCAALELLPKAATHVTVKTIDRNGTPVPWVTLGAAWTPFPPHEDHYWPRLQPEDLKRLLFRNPEAWEYWNNYHDPVMMIRFSGLTDQSGRLEDKIDYVNAAGSGSEWPSELTITYGGYRRGYRPTTGQVKVSQSSSGVEITLVLESASDSANALPSYLQTYYEIRHELADWHRNEDISQQNYERLENLRKRLADASAMALANGDRSAAAEIMYWVAYMPEVSLFNGKPNGFAQTTQSPRNYEAIKKAAEYEPGNAHIQAQAMLYESWWWNRENDAGRITYADVKQLRRKWLERAVALDKLAGDRLWAKFHEEIANTYGFFEMYPEEIAKLEWLQHYDPSWRNDLESRIDRIKARMLTKPAPSRT